MIDMYSIIFWILGIIFTVFLAKKKGRSVSAWFLVSVFLGIFAVVGILFARNLKNNRILGLNKNDSIIVTLFLIVLIGLLIPTVQKVHKNYLNSIRQKKKTDDALNALNTKLHLDEIRRDLESYRAYHGSYPLSLKELYKGYDHKTMKRIKKRLLLDEWGHPYRYITESDEEGRIRSYKLYSAGRDGIFDTEDDLYGMKTSK